MACTADELAKRLDHRPTWILRAGAWVLASPHLVASATGMPLFAFGAISGDAAWQALLARSGGVLGEVMHEDTPRVVSLLAEDPSPLRALLRQGSTLDTAAWALARGRTQRAVRAHTLDVGFDDGVRVCMAVTTLHRGGAERIAVDLSRALVNADVRVLFAVMSDSQSDTYPEPHGTLRIHAIAPKRARITTLARAASKFGADVIHAHLFGEDELGELGAAGIPLIVTVHNDRARFATGFHEVVPEGVAMTLACSWRGCDALASDPSINGPVRVAPNFAMHDRAEVVTREGLDVPKDACLVLCVANPRSQKRLELAVETLDALRQRGRDAYLVIAGGVIPGTDGEASVAKLDAAIERAGLESFVRRIGAQRDVGGFYEIADVVLTTSLYEGMSVVQLEALARGVPVVTTDVGGAAELSAMHEGYRVAAANPEALADAVSIQCETQVRPKLAAQFTSEAAAARHVRAYRSAALHDGKRAGRRGLVLVINNFATGGAQASARRLLLELHARGHDVAAAVLQEQVGFPTPWREALARTLPVFVAPRAGTCAADVTAAAVVDFVHERHASNVVFWNVMPHCKLSIADELTACTIHDVSPGEMYFSELDRYFAKPASDLPYFDARQYGTLLDGVIVKFAAEAQPAERVLGAPVTVIPNGVRVPPLGHTRRPRGERFVIGTLARIAPDKKLEQLLRAMDSVPEGCELRIAGRVEAKAAAYADELRELARRGVSFVGEADSEAFLADIDAFAMVSEPEGCPNALLEAMAAGLPVAATNVGGVGEMIVDGQTGLLVPRGDARALGDALARLARDEALARALGRTAREHIARHFSLARMVDAYESTLGLERGLRKVAAMASDGQDVMGEFREVRADVRHHQEICSGAPRRSLGRG